MNIRQNLVNKEKYDLKCPYALTPKFITIHNTENDASADAEVRYMIGNNEATAFHFCVDDKEVVQGIPTTRNAFANGDGATGTGNKQSISIEIAYSLSGGNRFYKAVDNAVQLTAQLMKQFNIPIENVVQHNRWSGKDCPKRMRAEGLWDKFINDVKAALNPTKPSIKPPVENKPSSNSLAGKRVESLVDGLSFYDSPRWNKPSGTLDKGYGFTIISKVAVEDAAQYKVKNSKGDIYYVTASPKFVTLK